MTDRRDRPYKVKVERNVAAETRDGTVLRADVYRPDSDASHPVILCRTPYDKTGEADTARQLASRGYIAVAQDVRGRYASDGEFFWQFQDNSETFDAQDGYDAVEWAAGLPGSDGQVGTWGHSYPSWCIWRMAATRPPHLKALFAGGMASRLMDLTFGIFETGRRLQWTHNMAVNARRRAGNTSGPGSREEADRWWQEVHRGKWVWHLPLDDVPDEVFSTLAPKLKRYMREQNKEFWAFPEIHGQVAVPTCQLTGWYDRLIGTVDNFAGMAQNGPEAVNNQHRIVIGPWGHSNVELVGRQGPLDFGPQAHTTYIGEVARWYDYRFKGVDKGIGSEPPVKLFVMGENRWRFEEQWPPPGTRYVEFFLHSNGAANTVRGDGVLSTTEPQDERPDEYDYDPRDPVMSLMGLDAQAAPRDQAPLDDREDILVYATPPLASAVEVIGPVVLKLWASSSAVETDFTAKLIDVHPSGLAVNLSYGIMRTSYRGGYENPAPMQAGEPYEFTVKLGPTGIRFGEGHRIRLDISSSDFPNFDRNHNTGADFWSDAELRTAHQEVYHDREHPSRLVLPLTRGQPS
ncbi:MAG: CocE/NonD family hydrolase [Chloroflexi bacterium]|nr:CocE/NonD family hydrolase [Chloroflexota bacterium]